MKPFSWLGPELTLTCFNHFLNLEEDREMVSSLQNNLSSSVFQPGPMSKLEKSVYNLINGYLDRMSAESE